MCAIPFVVFLLRWLHEAIHALVWRLLGARPQWKMRLKLWPDVTAAEASRGRRIAAALVTPVALYFAGVALPATVLLALLGERSISTTAIASVRPDSPGEAAGLREGDVILAVDAVAVADGDAVRREVRRHPDRAITLRVRRQGAETSLEVTPRRTPQGVMMGVVLAGRSEPIRRARRVRCARGSRF